MNRDTSDGMRRGTTLAGENEQHKPKPAPKHHVSSLLWIPPGHPTLIPFSSYTLRHLCERRKGERWNFVCAPLSFSRSLPSSAPQKIFVMKQRDMFVVHAFCNILFYCNCARAILSCFHILPLCCAYLVASWMAMKEDFVPTIRNLLEWGRKLVSGSWAVHADGTYVDF